MKETSASERKASAAEIRAHAPKLRAIVAQVGLSNARLRDDGTVVVHSEHPGYREVIELSNRLTKRCTGALRARHHRNILAHALAGDVSTDRVWNETVADLPRLLEEFEPRLHRPAVPEAEDLQR